MILNRKNRKTRIQEIKNFFFARFNIRQRPDSFIGLQLHPKRSYKRGNSVRICRTYPD